jgi:A/G-specific adenine glycosylase
VALSMHSEKQLSDFKKTIWHYYYQHKREFPWRNIENPYGVLISEIMLQQTQTYRVQPKYEQFMNYFPSLETLAHAPQSDVIKQWQGLGYNRRALALHRTAQIIVQEYNGIVPDNPETLVTFPGIGKATAASIVAFAYDKPTIFIETNIRAVFIFCFFSNANAISDQQLLPLVQETLDQEHPREWYYALMDYGVMLKKTTINPSRLSKHHTKQSKFEGSDRQIRGMILKLLSREQTLTIIQFKLLIKREPQRIERVIEDLLAEGFLKKSDDFFSLA